MKTEKTYWQRFVEQFVRRAAPATPHGGPLPHGDEGDRPALVDLTRQPKRRAMDVDENDKVLAETREDDPLWRVLLNYAYTHAENNLAVAFDVSQSIDAQRDFKNRAAGITAFIGDVESTRIRLREEILKKQNMEKKG